MPGLNAITGETGAGKTILSNAIGLLLGARGDAAMIGAASDEAYVEAELDLPDDEVLGELAELRPEGEESLVLARRIFADGRTRAYAWGRSAAREDVAAAVEALLAMSGQFEQRRLARPSYQLATLDAYAGTADTARVARRAWRELTAAREGPRRAHPRRSGRRGTARGAPRARRGHRRPRPGRGGRPARRAGAPAPRDRARARRGNRARGARRRRPRRRRRPGRRRRALRGAPRGDRARARRRRRERSAPPSSRSGRWRSTCGASSTRSRPSPADSKRSSAVSTPLPTFADDTAPAPTRSSSSGGEAREPSSTPSPRATTLRGRRPTTLAGGQAEVDRIHAELASRAPRGGAAVRRRGRRRARRGRARRGRVPRRSSASPTPALRGPTRPSSRSGRTRASRSGRSPRPPRAVSSPASRSRSPPSAAATRWSSTRSTPASAARPRTQSGETLRRLAARAQVITITHLPQIASLADRHFRVEKVPGDPTHTRIEPLARRRAPRGARAHARRRRLPGHALRRRAWLALRVSSWPRSTTRGGSSPSPTTSPTGGPESSACSRTGAASSPGRAGRSR